MSKRFVLLSVRLPVEVRQDIEDGARRNGLSMNAEIVVRLRAHHSRQNIADAVLHALDDERVWEKIKYLLGLDA